jgi:Fe-S cluster assembly iron-binding protein IscA
MSVRITQKAKEMIINQLKDKKQENMFLRIFVQGFG